MANQVDMRVREAAIISFIKANMPGGSTVKEIWQALREDEYLGDSITIQAYHRIINKMVARGKLVLAEGADTESKKFVVADYLTSENALSLTDIEEGLWSLSPPDALARYMDALDYFEGRQKDILHKAAQALMEEDPVDLVLEMLQDKIARLFESLADYNDPETRDTTVEQELARHHEELIRIVHSYYGISATSLDLGDIDKVKSGQHTIKPDWTKIREAIQKRVFGDKALHYVDIDKAKGSSTPQMFSVGGSDGSTHAGFVHLVPGAQFIDDTGQLVLTFNNSLAKVCLPDAIAKEYDFPYHGVPMTRAALEDPSNRGMIIARPWYPNLSDSEYEHMKKSALDVVQFRVDERIMHGTARALGTDRSRGSGRLLPRPQVHFRDGTVVPQEREFQHYNRRDEYGEMVQEGIALSYSILNAVKESDRLVFAGAVKSTQLKTFSTLLNWYIARGSKKRRGKPIDPEWDISRACHINDNHAMTRLLTSLSDKSDSKCLCSFAVLRPFPQLVTTLSRRRIADSEWVDHFQDITDKRILEQQKYGGESRYLSTVHIPDDPYVRMCCEADYVMFYIGHSGGDPSPVLPRYEFLDSIHRGSLPDIRNKVSQRIKLIVDSVVATGWSLDADHNFMTKKTVTRIIPAVLYDAHEKCKVWGHKLESELKSAIIARLAERRRIRGAMPTRFDLIPVEIRQYLQQMRSVLKDDEEASEQLQLPESTEDQK